MDIQTKADAAREQIAALLEKAGRPVVLWSGGKDSTVLLHLARQVRPQIECVFWTLPWMRGKLGFAQELAAMWNLTVHDAPPASATLCAGNGRIDVMETYAMKGEGQGMIVARGTEPRIEGKPFVCGVEWLERPKAVAAFPFDLALHGHRSADIDPCSGGVPLAVDVLQYPRGTDIAFPLRDWSDPDVWTYHKTYGVPWDSGRYDGAGKSLPDKTANSDYFHACFDCVRAKSDSFVPCPKRGGLTVNGVAERVPWSEPKLSYCNLRN